MKWWDQMPGFLFSECWALSQLTVSFLLCCLNPRHPVKQLLIWFLLLRNTLHILPCMCCLELSFHFTTCWKKTASQQCPKSPGKDIHQHRPASPLRCLSVLVPLIKPHRFLFIKIMPRKPWILPKVRVQQNAKEELRHTERKHSKSVQIRLPIFIQKTPKCKVDQSFK